MLNTVESDWNIYISLIAPANPPDWVWVDGSCWDQTAFLAWRVGATNNEEIYEYWIDWSTTYDTTNWTRLPKVLEEDTKPVRLNFNLLPPFSQISFRVTVFNRIGAGEPSIPTDPSDCITKPAGKLTVPIYSTLTLYKILFKISCYWPRNNTIWVKGHWQ